MSAKQTSKKSENASFFKLSKEKTMEEEKEEDRDEKPKPSPQKKRTTTVVNRLPTSRKGEKMVEI